MAELAQQLLHQVVNEVVPSQSWETLSVNLELFGVNPNDLLENLAAAIDGQIDLGEAGQYLEVVVSKIGYAVEQLRNANTAGQIKDALPGYRAVEERMDSIRSHQLAILQNRVWRGVTDQAFMAPSGGRVTIDLAMQSRYAVRIGDFEQMVIQQRSRFAPGHRSERNKNAVLHAIQDRITADIVSGQRQRPPVSRPYAVATIVDMEIRQVQGIQWIAPVLNILAEVCEAIPLLSALGPFLRYGATMAGDIASNAVEELLRMIARLQQDLRIRIANAEGGRQIQGGQTRPGGQGSNDNSKLLAGGLVLLALL